MQDEILGHEVRRERAFELKPHRLRYLHPELAGPHDEGGVGVADAAGEFPEGAGCAGVRIGAEQHLAGTGVAFLRKRDVTDSFVLVCPDVVIVRQILLLHEASKEIDIAVGMLIVGKDVVIGNDDDLLAVPDLGIRAELLVKDSDRPGTADIMGHEDVYVHPDVVAGSDAFVPGMPGQNLLGHRHGHAFRCPRRNTKFILQVRGRSSRAGPVN